MQKYIRPFNSMGYECMYRMCLFHQTAKRFSSIKFFLIVIYRLLLGEKILDISLQEKDLLGNEQISFYFFKKIKIKKYIPTPYERLINYK